MLETLKKKAKKTYMTRIIAAIVVLVVLLVIGGSSILSLITGPTSLNRERDFETLKGKYVSYDASYLLIDFCTYTTVDTDTKRETINGSYYIVYDEKNDLFFGIYLPYSLQDKAFDLIDESWAWMYGEIDAVSYTIPVKGTLRPITGEILTYYNEEINNCLDSEYMDRVMYYYIDTQKSGSLDNTWIYIIIAGIALSLVSLILSIVRMLTTSPDKKIQKYIDSNPSISLPAIESDFAAAHAYKDHWIGKNWTIYLKGTKAHIFANKDIVWAYYFKRTGKNYVSQIQAYSIDKKCFTIDMHENTAMEVLSYYSAEQPHMVIGYSKEWESLYKKNFQGFLDLKYKAAAAAAPIDPSTY